MMTKDQFKDLFLKLTEYTIPFGDEAKLEPYLPKGYTKDAIGNYFYEIGESETLFTTHLDTYSDRYEKVNQIVEGDWISTDERTILGGDNKLGTAILINMINEGKPGTYYFFVGEEPLASGGLYGSRKALASKPDYFKKFKRVIAFDRREYGSIVTRQMARNCCSKEFVLAIADGLKQISGIEWDQKGGLGYYTDTAVFMDVIPEVTNLSAGGFREHHEDEYADLAYTYKVLNFALKMDWESLPVVRELDNEEEVEYKPSGSKLKKFLDFKKEKVDRDKLINQVINAVGGVGLELTKEKQTASGLKMLFAKWLEEVEINLIIDNDNNIIVDGKEMDFKEFRDYLAEFRKKEIEKRMNAMRK